MVYLMELSQVPEIEIALVWAVGCRWTPLQWT